MMFGVILFFILYIGLIVLMLVSHWKIYTKAGKPGWACIVPIYSIIVLLEIVKKPMIWILYLLIPIVNIIFFIKLSIELAKVFGKDTGFAVGMIFLPFIFIPMLAFGDATYQSAELDLTQFGKPEANPNFETR